MKIAVTRLLPGSAIQALTDKKYEVSVPPSDRDLERRELLEIVKGASAIISLLTDKIDAAVFDAAGPSLKIVANYAVGFDNVDLREAEKRGIYVTNTPSETITTAVAEHALALIGSLAKRVTEADRFVRSGAYHGWDPNLFVGQELTGKTLGIVGLGRIGSLVARIAGLGFKMRILYESRSRQLELERELAAEFVSLADLLRRSDFVSLHVPLLPETEHLINRGNLVLMKKTAFLINTSRGAVVEEAALVDALDSQTIAGAALDVFEREPKINPRLFSLPNVVLTPHIASATREARGEMGRIAVANVVEALEGRVPPNRAFVSA